MLNSALTAAHTKPGGLEQHGDNGNATCYPLHRCVEKILSVMKSCKLMREQTRTMLGSLKITDSSYSLAIG